ncbi:hypothetical protein [uncultured Pontibacter sp.]|uniref:hypothetical protein n=1 Tax=uncultured Pontibacter sp. TaxID=453356 RepID=UPI00260E06D8|nr:hypothetical protein [uncultured Pontibacter sp.]
MKKSLNDSLREEFNKILNSTDIKEKISTQELDLAIIIGAFDKLLAGERFLEATDDDIEKTRTEFENYILNTLKTKQHQNDN